jgi:hypothetical protein
MRGTKRERKFQFGWMAVRAVTSLLMFSLLIWPVASATSAIGSAANETTFSGRATVINGKVLGVPITLVDTGEVNPAGGSVNQTLLEYPNGLPDVTGGVLNARVLHATVVAQGNKSRAQATVAQFNLVNVAGNNISAEFLSAEAEAKCTVNGVSIGGSAEVVDLVVNGTPIVVTGEVNQTIPLPLPGGGAVIINEQTTDSGATADKGGITVNALHIKIPGVLPVPDTDTDIIIASAHADITCASPRACPNDKDFVTGGGYILSESGSKRHFAVAGGIKNGDFWGHLSYMDREKNLKVKGTGVTSYTNIGPTSRHIEGTCEINGTPGRYLVDVADNGEPGRSDTFKITLFPGEYTAAGMLAGGNIQLHFKACK